MEKKRIIPIGTKWTMLTYIEDVENDNPSKRPIRVICECGKVKVVDMASLNAGTTRTCGSTICRNKLHQVMQNQADRLKRELMVKEYHRSSELNKLSEYWDEIEKNGNVHNIAMGMSITHDFLELK